MCMHIIDRSGPEADITLSVLGAEDEPFVLIRRLTPTDFLTFSEANELARALAACVSPLSHEIVDGRDSRG
jgi:hypothetical protein